MRALGMLRGRGGAEGAEGIEVVKVVEDLSEKKRKETRRAYSTSTTRLLLNETLARFTLVQDERQVWAMRLKDERESETKI